MERQHRSVYASAVFAEGEWCLKLFLCLVSELANRSVFVSCW